MNKTITLSARTGLTRAVRERYRAASGAAKHQILTEFVSLSGYHPKSAICILNQHDEELPRSQTRNRPRLYDEAAQQALIVMWEASDRVCGTRSMEMDLVAHCGDVNRGSYVSIAWS